MSTLGRYCVNLQMVCPPSLQISHHVFLIHHAPSMLLEKEDVVLGPPFDWRLGGYRSSSLFCPAKSPVHVQRTIYYQFETMVELLSL